MLTPLGAETARSQFFWTESYLECPEGEQTCACVCVWCSCVCVRMWVNTCVWKCVEFMQKSEVNLRCHSYLSFWDRVLHWDLGLIAWRLRWLTSKPQGSSRLYLPRAGITSESHHAWFFMWILRLEPRFSGLCGSHFKDWHLPSSQACIINTMIFSSVLFI